VNVFEFDEGRLRFAFDEQWKVIKWDDHAAHRKSMNALDKSKAIDFIGIYRNRQAFFIEVKDYRHYERTNPEPLKGVVEAKVRNTVAGLVGAHRREEYKSECSPFLDAVCNKELNLVLWLEAARPEETLNAKSKIRLSMQLKREKPHVSWLNARLVTCQLADYERVLPGLRVTTLARPAKKD
jgi:hypothetical protein